MPICNECKKYIQKQDIQKQEPKFNFWETLIELKLKELILVVLIIGAIAIGVLPLIVWGFTRNILFTVLAGIVTWIGINVAVVLLADEDEYVMWVSLSIFICVIINALIFAVINKPLVP